MRAPFLGRVAEQNCLPRLPSCPPKTVHHLRGCGSMTRSWRRSLAATFAPGSPALPRAPHSIQARAQPRLRRCRGRRRLWSRRWFWTVSSEATLARCFNGRDCSDADAGPSLDSQFGHLSILDPHRRNALRPAQLVGHRQLPQRKPIDHQPLTICLWYRGHRLRFLRDRK